MNKLWLCEKNNWEKKSRVLFFNGVPHNYRNVCCKQCGLVYVNPRMSDWELIVFYQKQYRELCSIKDKEGNIGNSHYGIEIYNAVTRYDFLKRLGYIKAGICTLDIGSSLGALPAYLHAKGCSAYGVELSPYASYTKELFGIDTIFRMPFDALETDLRFDIVTICDALEHFSHPKNVLLKIRNLLKDEGIVLIEIPDIFKPHKSVLGFFSNAHLFTFSPNSIKNLLDITGFDIVHFEYGGYCKNMRIVVKKGDIRVPSLKDDFHDIKDFILRYNRVYTAKEFFMQTKISYDEAQEIVKENIPAYIVIKVIEALRRYDSGDVLKAIELLRECLDSDFNEEDISLQEGNIQGLLAIMSANIGDWQSARVFMEKAFVSLPKLFDFPYLANLKERGIFDIERFIMERWLCYIELFKLKDLLEKNRLNKHAGNIKQKSKNR
ncbi:hypothetical protein A45J_0064 [hot springs metagenome]|uniref:Class I SAM-dependent methyltransferase n=1 Tax=hot springs metagenome TaxID=433727 RepID=A0A5J4L223_9ZZZZ